MKMWESAIAGKELSVDAIVAAVAALQPYMLDTLQRLVRAPSQSGDEWAATRQMEEIMAELGLAVNRIPLDTDALCQHGLYSPRCHPDAGRYNLLSIFEGASGPDEDVRSVLFNGHLDVVPTGPEGLWTDGPYNPVVKDGWMYGRGSGDMKAGIVCTLVALKALRHLGYQPKGRVGFNWVLEEECTGNGALASALAIQKGSSDGRSTKFDGVIIPEPLGDGLVCAQVGVFWMNIELTGRPAHAAMMASGVNPINAAIEIMADLRILEQEWNRPENRHPAFHEHDHPINFNLGRMAGGEWNSSVPCTCSMGVRIGVFPGVDIDEAKKVVSERITETVERIGKGLKATISYEGFQLPGV
ncbi:M20/M25/M40 family metallo-hydrolase, partial [Herbaspirillum sp. B65]|uniref:M20/M25/M40 family metallo-hydrolase n=1 Tax=Herbaspirillum sp. B65 TaxID=137708 RepID=UPI00067959E0